LCKEIARIHGTELAFESEKGKGTRVSFILSKGGAEK
jgi:signal transduction histidine kinase